MQLLLLDALTLKSTSGKVLNMNSVAPVSEWRPVGNGIWAHKYGIIGTKHLVYRAYEPLAGHSALTYRDGIGYGDISSRELPAELEALDYGPERVRKVRSFQSECKSAAHRVIKAAYPNDKIRLAHGEGSGVV